MISRVRPSGAVYGDAVEALDHLGARGPEAQVEAPVAQRVDPGRGHGDERRRPRVDRQDPRPDLDALGERRQVAHEARAVEAVGLGDPDEVEAGGLHLCDGCADFLKPPEYAKIVEIWSGGRVVVDMVVRVPSPQ